MKTIITYAEWAQSCMAITKDGIYHKSFNLAMSPQKDQTHVKNIAVFATKIFNMRLTISWSLDMIIGLNHFCVTLLSLLVILNTLS